jgi:2-C-methyl-D-erythritol 2,4-cyclodiphosphate synthase
VRSTLGAAQTPQGIRTELLREAYARFPADAPETFTDEAALLEACKLPVHAIPGNDRNFKVTLPSDLARVATLLGAQPGTELRPAAARVRVGYGSDSHPFGPAMGLALGGLVVDGAPRLYGHSDGDVLLHAIADAMLGAAGLGDLGRIFPAGPTTPEGIASHHLLAEVVHGVRSHGFAVETVDCTIVAARPRLASRLPAIGERIAELLRVDPSAVNVKASTGNLDGMEGAGRGISATAVVALTSAPDDR